MRKVIMLLSLMVSMTVFAQDFEIIRRGCIPTVEDGDAATARAGQPHRLATPNTDWDANRIYRQLVILIEFEGDETYFKSETPRDDYDRMLNETGYNERNGKGCLADYFRDQSNGLFNVQFDVYGPYRVGQKAQPYDSPNDKTQNYGREAMTAATRLFVDENPDLDFSVYDWNNNGSVNQVIYVAAGYSGNISDSRVYGYIWPSTSSFSSIRTPDGKTISNYSCSCELWPNNASCGFGTICHEFTHSLGLPDIYPTSSEAGYSVCDEWELMDGGNFTNYGWCPPNYTALEKMLLGWLTPIELTEKTAITDLKPVEEGGEAYQIKHSANEYLLLENRQQRGWDLGAPGKGLVIYHVQYDKSAWSGNRVNNVVSKRRFELVHADNLDYDAWEDYLKNSGLSTYAEKPRLGNRHLSTSPYPFVTENEDGTPLVNDQLTDTSVPPVKMNYANDEGSLLLGKPVTNITMTDDGLVSFEFMGDPSSGIVDLSSTSHLSPLTSHPSALYDLQGRRIYGQPTRGLVIKDGKLINFRK